MARYIDADAFKQRLTDKDIFFPALYKNELDDIPTADVVPKSEVDLYRKQVDELEDELASTYDKLQNAKAEVVKDISDLKKVVHDSAVFPLGKDTYSYVSLKVVDALLRNILNKYTEGENGRAKNVHDEDS